MYIFVYIGLAGVSSVPDTMRAVLKWLMTSDDAKLLNWKSNKDKVFTKMALCLKTVSNRKICVTHYSAIVLLRVVGSYWIVEF